jgi:hypothetical protein
MTTMHLDRRDALKTMAAGLVSFIIPAPRKSIDLAAFCAREPGRYDLTKPYELDDYVFASDAKICVRIAPESADRTIREGKIPPFGTLPWDHDRLRGWRPLPELPALRATGANCPACDGTGNTLGIAGRECEGCDGDGEEWVDPNDYRRTRCRTCHGSGFMLPAGASVCPTCSGHAIGTFPSVVNLDGRFFDAKLYDKVRRLGVEYVTTDWHRGVGVSKSDALLSFRFDGGRGMLMGHDPAKAARRIAAALEAGA